MAFFPPVKLDSCISLYPSKKAPLLNVSITTRGERVASFNTSERFEQTVLSGEGLVCWG